MADLAEHHVCGGVRAASVVRYSDVTSTSLLDVATSVECSSGRRRT
jgi:phosphoribosylanthranilate isomerase